MRPSLLPSSRMHRLLWSLLLQLLFMWYIRRQFQQSRMKTLLSYYETAALIFLLAFILISVALALFIQCNENVDDIATTCFLVINVIFILSLSFAIWVCNYPHGYIPAVIFCVASIMALLIIWIWKFKKPKCLHALKIILCGLQGDAAPNAVNPHEQCKFLRGTPFVLYGLIMEILYAVFEHGSSAKSLPHGFKIANFIVLIAGTEGGYYLFLFTQLYDRAADIGLAVWSFIILIAILMFSLGYALVICLYPKGFLPGALVFFVCTLLLFVIWPVMCSKPECLHKCFLEVKTWPVKTWPNKFMTYFKKLLGYEEQQGDNS